MARRSGVVPSYFAVNIRIVRTYRNVIGEPQMIPSEIGIRRKVKLDPESIGTGDYYPYSSSCRYERVLKIGDRIYSGIDSGLHFDYGCIDFPCSGRIFDMYPFSEMRRVNLGIDGNEVAVEGIDSSFSDNPSGNIDVMIRCPKVYFKDEIVPVVDNVWGYEYHWVCKYKADEKYYVDPFHVRYDGEVFNGYCYISAFDMVNINGIDYSKYGTQSYERRSANAAYNNVNVNKNAAKSSSSNAYWSVMNVQAWEGYWRKLQTILEAANSTEINGSTYVRERYDQCKPRKYTVQMNDFGMRHGRGTGGTSVFESSRYGDRYVLNMHDPAQKEYDTILRTLLGVAVRNGDLYFARDYRDNKADSLVSGGNIDESKWIKSSLKPISTANYYGVTSFRYPPEMKYFPVPWTQTNTVTARNQFGYATSTIGSSTNTIYTGRVRIQEASNLSRYFDVTVTSEDVGLTTICYPDSLNGKGAPQGEGLVAIQTTSPEIGATIQNDSYVTYTFAPTSAKPSMYDLSNMNALIGRFADGQFVFGSQYEGDVTWTETEKVIRCRRRQGWLTGSCNIWLQASDDQS